MSHEPPPDQYVREVVASADARRRRRDVTRSLTRLAPAAAAVCFAVAVAGRLAGWPLIIPSAAAALLVVALVSFVIVRRRARAATDAIAADVDGRAGLSGELRSAHWFATNLSPESPDLWKTNPSPFATYHLEQAARRAAGVDWKALYPPVRATRAWVVTALLIVGAAAAAVRLPARAAASHARGGESAIAAGAIPEDLRKQLEALLAEMKDASLSDDAARMKLRDLKELMSTLTPEQQKQLADMLKRAAAADANAEAKKSPIDEEEISDRLKRGENSNAGLPEDVRWALDDLASRLANASIDRKTAKDNPAASSETGEPGRGSSQAETSTTTSAEASMQIMREAASDPGAAKMMMGGGGMMGGDSRSGAGGNSGARKGEGDATLLVQALRRELVEAAVDAAGKNVPIEDIRRKTEQGQSTLGFTRAAAATFDRGRDVAPPPVPDARRLLLYNYFRKK